MLRICERMYQGQASTEADHVGTLFGQSFLASAWAADW